MAKIVQAIEFSGGGLDSDTSNLYMQPGSSPYFLNIMKGEDGNQGIITNAKGNLQITYQQELTLSNTYFVLGSYYNVLTRKAYFFIFSQPYDSGGGVYLYDNRLLCYNEDAQTIDTIFLDTNNWFELDPTKKLVNMKMLETWLFFNPVTAQPKMIDVDMAYNYTNYEAYDDTDPSSSYELGDKVTYRGGLFVANTSVVALESPVLAPTKWDRIGNSYQDESSVTETEFTRAFYAIKIPPIDRIVHSYGSDTDANFNNVEGITFRFAHRYKYFDNSYSVYSAHSEITTPMYAEAYNGQIIGSTIINNYIQLSFSLYSAALIKNIEIVFQEIGGDWKRMAVIDRQNQSLLDTINYTYNFYNNESYPEVAEGTVDIIEDAIPPLAATQEIINENVLCFAGCTEGFPNLDKDLMDVTLTPEVVPIYSPYSIPPYIRDNIASDDISEQKTYDSVSGKWIYYSIIDIGTWFSGVSLSEYDGYRGVINGNPVYALLLTSDIDTAAHLAAKIATAYAGATVYNVGGTVQVWIPGFLKYHVISESGIYTPPAILTTMPKQKGFKTGAYHPFCRFYYDEALRRSAAQIGDGLVVYVPSVNDYSPPVATNEFRWVIGWEVNDTPPSWAKYWKWGYAGNRRCDYFVQYIIEGIADGSEDVANTLAIDITPLQTIRTTTESGWNSFPNSQIPAYEFTEGDRIRFMTEETDPSVASTRLGATIDGIVDFEILKFDTDTNLLYVQTFNYAGYSIGENTLVEIYTPTKETAVETYFEFGDIMPIITDADGNLAHGGVIQDQDLSASPLPATGTFDGGDVYHIFRTPSKPLCTDGVESTWGAFHESMWWSDFYDSDDWDRGKLGLESPIGRVTLNIVRFSNVFLQNTQINGLTTFEATNYKELNDVYGNIISIIEIGDTLKVYQEKKPSSILIGRTEYTDTSGSGNVVVSPSILGSIRYSRKNFGTVFPESISKNNQYVYGFDIYNGTPWRDGNNGIFSIAGRLSAAEGGVDYKMKTYFKNKSKALLESGIDHCSILSVWDEEYECLYVVFKDSVNHNNNETVIFNEKENRWVNYTAFSYTPADGFNVMLEPEYSIVQGFPNGIGYVFDEETRFATFNIGGGLGTPDNLVAFPSLLELTFTLLAPAVLMSPSPPVAKAATAIGEDTFTANWDPSKGVTGYYLDVSEASDFSTYVAGYETLDVGAVLTYAVTGLTTYDTDHTYYYRVRAYNTVGTSGVSATITTYTSGTVPVAPVATAATSVLGLSFMATWSSSVTANVIGYKIDVATDSGFVNILSDYNDRSVGLTNEKLIDFLAYGTTYYYRVRAINTSSGISANSNTITVTTLSLPMKVIALAATLVSYTSFQMNWTVSALALGYRYDVSRNPEFTDLIISNATTPTAATSLVVSSGIVAYTTYYYRIRSYNLAGTSSNSNTISLYTGVQA